MISFYPGNKTFSKWAVTNVSGIGMCWVISNFQLPEFDIFQCGLISLNVIYKQIK